MKKDTYTKEHCSTSSAKLHISILISLNFPKSHCARLISAQKATPCLLVSNTNEQPHFKLAKKLRQLFLWFFLRIISRTREKNWFKIGTSWKKKLFARNCHKEQNLTTDNYTERRRYSSLNQTNLVQQKGCWLQRWTKGRKEMTPHQTWCLQPQPPLYVNASKWYSIPTSNAIIIINYTPYSPSSTALFRDYPSKTPH